ncbi:MAG: LysM domain-containing protein [Jatrophihabitantaceae bacterium]
MGPDAAASTLASSLLWLVALWTAFGLSVTALSLLPGRVGLLAHAVAGRVTPAVLRRVVVAAAGTSILISPVTACAEPAASGASAPTGNSVGPAPAGALRLPMDLPGSKLDSSTAPPSAAPPSAMPPLGWPTDPAVPATGPGHTAAAPKPAASKPANPRPQESGDRVSVRPGDSLWSIAARRLGAAPTATRIQAEWPRWYAVNRQLIGADPDLLRPGASLLAPRPALLDTGE